MKSPVIKTVVADRPTEFAEIQHNSVDLRIQPDVRTQVTLVDDPQAGMVFAPHSLTVDESSIPLVWHTLDGVSATSDLYRSVIEGMKLDVERVSILVKRISELHDTTLANAAALDASILNELTLLEDRAQRNLGEYGSVSIFNEQFDAPGEKESGVLRSLGSLQLGTAGIEYASLLDIKVEGDNLEAGRVRSGMETSAAALSDVTAVGNETHYYLQSSYLSGHLSGIPPVTIPEDVLYDEDYRPSTNIEYFDDTGLPMPQDTPWNTKVGLHYVLRLLIPGEKTGIYLKFGNYPPAKVKLIDESGSEIAIWKNVSSLSPSQTEVILTSPRPIFGWVTVEVDGLPYSDIPTEWGSAISVDMFRGDRIYQSHTVFNWKEAVLADDYHPLGARL